MSRYDIVLYGASGFTGAYVLKLLVEEQEQQNVSFAIAGRSEARLKKLLDNTSQELGKDLQNISVIVANSYDESTLTAMAKQAKVIVNVVGPYRLYGEAVVKAAVENGASYVDISGEPAFLESMQMKYSDIAQKKGLYVVGACGWDSIPCDLGVNFLKEKFSGQLNHVETFVQLNSGPAGYSFNAGTYRTLVLGMANVLTDGLSKIRRSIMPERLPRSSFRAPKRGTFWFNEKIDGWCLPFYGSDKSVVTRSQYFDYKFRGVLPLQGILFYTLDTAHYVQRNETGWVTIKCLVYNEKYRNICKHFLKKWTFNTVVVSYGLRSWKFQLGMTFISLLSL
ncbi:saccharopine dehydrogenase [Loa loa]|uniref:Saccharopine dehydrogenase n=1 Tax=Loa loa TaxID=7209 RepID=A0A1S0UM10_LOALO|nr:saccharopine dehydrogenase [Loa loa]EJD75824.1 saccharopine dehydrogenase [Loa loa]